MKKVRVLKEMPFAKVGEESYTIEHGIFQYGQQLGGYNLYVKDIDKWIKDGWLEWVEEPKSLEEKLEQLKLRVTAENYITLKYEDTALVAQIAKEHYLAVVNKVIEECGVVYGRKEVIRKAIEEG